MSTLAIPFSSFFVEMAGSRNQTPTASALHVSNNTARIQFGQAQRLRF
jgi:hypothetical protein